MKQKHIILAIGGVSAVAGIYLLARALKSNGETVVFVPDTIYRGDPVTVVWDNFDDGVLGIGTLYTSSGSSVYSYSSYDGSGSIVISGGYTGLLSRGEYRLVVEQESVNKMAEAYLTVV